MSEGGMGGGGIDARSRRAGAPARRVLVVLVTFAMVVSPVAGVVGATGGAPANGTADGTMNATTNATVDAATTASHASRLDTALRARMAAAGDGEQVPVIVVTDDGASTDEPGGIGTLADSSGVGDAVAAAAERGAASDVHTFRTGDVMAMRATPETVRELAERSDVERVVFDRPVRALGAERPGPLGEFVDGLAAEGDLADAVRPTDFERSRSGDTAWGVDYVGADAVAARGIDGSGVNVSVVDTGIDADHPALRGQVIRWEDFVENASEPVDPEGHGTHVAGTVAGQPGNEHAVGVAPDTNLFGARALDANGGGSTSTVMEAFEWSVQAGADVVSASLGTSPYTISTFGRANVSAGETVSRNVSVYANVTDYYGTEGYRGFKPASVYVDVSPATNVSDRAAAMANLSVELNAPDGSAPLTRHEANWFFEGPVPNTTGLWKYKPSAGPVEPGNWSLSVTSTDGGTVPVEYEAYAIYPSNGSDQLSRFVDELAAANPDVTPVVAAGNDGAFGNRTVGSPGAAERAITVGATGYRIDDPAGFSSRGPVGYDAAKRPGVDLIAPGAGILSAAPSQGDAENYATKSGTSMATPHVAGAAALVLDATNGSANRADVAGTLGSTARDAPSAGNAAGAGVLDAWAAVNATAVELGTRNATPSETHTLYGGFGGAYEEYDDIQVPQLEDPEDAPAGAPDIAAVDRETRYGVHGKLHEPVANATFTLYVDTDADDATGLDRGAEEKLVLQRWMTPSGVEANLTRYVANGSSFEEASSGTEYVSDLAAFEFDREVRPDEEWHLVASNPNGTDTLPGTGQFGHTTDVNLSVPVRAIAWGTQAPAVDEEVTFDASIADETVAERTVRTGPEGTAETTLSLSYNITDQGWYSSLPVTISDEHGNTVERRLDVDVRGIDEYGPGDDSGEVIDPVSVDYRAERNETITVRVPIARAGTGESVPYNGTVRTYLDHRGEDIEYGNQTVERGILTQEVDLSEADPDTVEASLDIEKGNYGYSGYVDIRLDGTAEATLAPRERTVRPGAETNFSVQRSRFENGTRVPVEGSAAYKVRWLTDEQVHSLAANRSSSFGEALRAAANGDATLDEGERERARSAIETSGLDPRVRRGTVDTGAHGVGTIPLNAPENAAVGFVSAGPDTNSLTAGATVSVAGATDRFLGAPDVPPSDDGSLYINARWLSDGDAGRYEVDVNYYGAEENATVSLYATSGAHRTVTIAPAGTTTVNLSAPDPTGSSAAAENSQEVVALAHNRTADGYPLSDRDWLYPRNGEGRLRMDATHRDDTLNVALSYPDEPAWTLLRAGAPDTYDAATMPVVRFLNPANATPSYAFDLPSGPRERTDYDVRASTRTDTAYAYPTTDGLSTDVAFSRAPEPGETRSATVTVTDANGNAVPNATVVWSYTAWLGTSGNQRLPAPRAGDVRVATTDADGEASFTVAFPNGANYLSTTTRALTDEGMVTEERSINAYERDLPDLATEIDAPETVGPGESVTATATFTNRGTVTAPNASFGLWENRSATFASVNRSLAPGESVSVSVSAPANLSSYEFRAYAGLNRSFDELDTGNNYAERMTEVAADAPDLVADLDAPETVEPGESVTATATFENVGDGTAVNASAGIGIVNDSGPLKTLNRTFEPGESATLSVTLTRDVDTYRLAAAVSPDGTGWADVDPANNIARQNVSVIDPDTVELGFDPADATLGAGNTLDVNVTVDTRERSLYGATTVVEYDTDVLSAVDVSRGGFLGDDAREYNATVDDANGTVTLSAARLGTDQGIAGTGTLATVAFELAADAPRGASSPLEIGAGTQLANVSNDPVPYTSTPGTLSARTVDLSVRAALQDDVLNVGSEVSVGVEASANVGLDPIELVPPAADPVTATPSGETFTGELSFTPARSTWNGTGYETRNVTVEAAADGVSGTDSVPVTVHIAGDAGEDGRVNIFDAVAVGTAWGDAPYEPRADLNSDGEIGVEDAAILGQHWQDAAGEGVV